MKRQFAALLTIALLSACGTRPEQNVLELHCRGERVVDAQPATRVERLYRIDLRGAALDEWSSEASRFVRWGRGRVSISGGTITYVGEVRVMDRRILVRRQVEFDRSTRKIRDQAEASWGSVIAFQGECEER